MNKKQILIVANGLSKNGGIGNVLYNMILSMYNLYNNFDLDIMLFDSDSFGAVKEFPINLIKPNFICDLDISTKLLISKIIKKELPLRYLIHRVFYKFHYRLPLIQDKANSINYLEKKYDLAIAYNCIPSVITSFVAYRVKAKNKIAWSHMDVTQKYNAKLGRNSILPQLFLHKYKRTLQKFNKIYSVSNGVKDSLLKYISNHLSIEVFYNFTEKNTIIAMSKKYIPFKKESNELILLTVGRLSYEKGIKISLRTADKLKKAGIKFRWFFLGDINEKQYIESFLIKHRLKNNVVLTGPVSNPYPYFKHCDIYVHTSYVEGFCTSVNEARMLAKPIITTNAAGACEQITDGVNGFIVDRNPTKISTAIINLFNNKTLRSKMENNNANLEFNNADSIGKLKRLIDEYS